MNRATNERIGIDSVSVFGLPPIEYLDLAAGLGVSNIGLALEPVQPENPHGYPAWSLRSDAALRRDVIDAFRDTGISFALGEGFLGLPGTDADSFAGDLDLFRELGADRVCLLNLSDDLAEATALTAAFAELAAERNLPAVVEYSPGTAVDNLATTVDVVRHADNPNLTVLVDVMHFFRSGSSATELEGLQPGLIGYLQICDVPRVSTHDDYAFEALHDRLAPGQGDIPLAEFFAAAPDDVVVGIEVPRLDEARAGIGPNERLAPIVEATRALLA